MGVEIHHNARVYNILTLFNTLVHRVSSLLHEPQCFGSTMLSFFVHRQPPAHACSFPAAYMLSWTQAEKDLVSNKPNQINIHAETAVCSRWRKLLIWWNAECIVENFTVTQWSSYQWIAFTKHCTLKANCYCSWLPLVWHIVLQL